MKSIKLLAFTALLLGSCRASSANIISDGSSIILNADKSKIAVPEIKTDDVKPQSGKVRGYGISFGGGTILIPSGNFDMLNQHLTKNNYAAVPLQYTTWNMRMIHAIYKNTVFNMDFGGILQKNTVTDSSKTTMTGSSFNLALGKVIYHGNKLIIYPMAGVDFGSFNLHSHFTGADKASDISGDNVYRSFDFSLNIDYLFHGFDEKVDWNASSKAFPIHGTGLLSFTIGYVYCPSNTYWNDSNYDISSRFNTNVNYPANVIGSTTSSNFSMLYASLKIGFGSFYK